MEINLIKDEKDNLIVESDNTTLAELLRVYLGKDDSIVLAAWKQENSNKKAILEIKTKGKNAKKALTDALGSIEKDLDNYSEEFKKAFK